MAEPKNQEVKSRRDMAVERLRQRYPDKEFNDDEAIFGQIYDDYDELDGQLNGYKEREQSFVDMMTKDPRSAHFVNNWRQGADPVVEMIRQFGDMFKEALDDPSRLDDIAAAHKEYLDRVAESKELDDIFEKNFAESQKTRDQFQADNGLSDDEIDAVIDRMEKRHQEILRGIYSYEGMQEELNAIRHDSDVAAAADEAEVRGRNAKINETLRRRQEGDGVAPLGGSAGKVEEPKRRMNIFDYAEAAK